MTHQPRAHPQWRAHPARAALLARGRPPADREEPAPPLLEDTRTGLCIVGGGFTGLWTAILVKQMRPDLDIVLIEADICGGGASGRNGGRASTWSTKFFTLQRLYGDAEAIRMVRASEQAVFDIEQFCADYGIDCEWLVLIRGTLFTATSAAQMGASDAVMAALSRHGICSWTRLDTEDVKPRAGSRAHLEGWFSPVAATVHPGKAGAWSAARSAMRLGVRVSENTPMLQIEHGAPAAVRTPKGTVRADTVVVAINAWMASTFREFARTIAIVSSDMVITEPSPPQLAATGLDGGISVMDSRTFVHYYRSTTDGRLMLGKGGNTFAFGGRMLRVFDEPSPYRDLRQRLGDFMPLLERVPIAASWTVFRPFRDRPAVLRAPERRPERVLRLRLLGNWCLGRPTWAAPSSRRWYWATTTHGPAAASCGVRSGSSRQSPYVMPAAFWCATPFAAKSAPKMRGCSLPLLISVSANLRRRPEKPTKDDRASMAAPGSGGRQLRRPHRSSAGLHVLAPTQK